MEILNLQLSELKPYSKNAKLHTQKQIKQVAASIKEFGWAQPVVVDRDFNVIIGHCRIEAAKELGYTAVPVVKMEHLTDEQVKALRLADNRLNESAWDASLVLEELKELKLQNFDIELTGFDDDYMNRLSEDDFDGQKEHDKIVEPTTKPGDIFQLGEHRLMCGSSDVLADLQRLMGEDKANLVFTDPPYGVNYKSPGGLDYNSDKYGGTGGKIFNDDKNDEENLFFYTQVLENIYQVTTDDCPIYWWYASKNLHVNRAAFVAAKWYPSQTIVWVKNSMVYSRGQDFHRQYEPCLFGWKHKKTHYKDKKISDLKDVFVVDGTDNVKDAIESMMDVWLQARDITVQYVHPTQKPVRLAERGLKKHSQLGGVVLDCFGGSGSTLIGCEQFKRKCRVMELDPKYCDVIIKRWEQFTGEKAVKL